MTTASIRTLSFTLAAALACAPATLLAQQGTASQPSTQTGGQYSDAQRADHSSAPDMSVPDTDAPHSWTEQQILTATVHQAWMLAGKDEAKFFEIVRELAEIAARNRHVQLPDDPTAGKRAGEYIKEQAKADHDQLLYSIVDKAIQMTGKPTSSTTASSH